MPEYLEYQEKIWNWQQIDWPNFSFDMSKLELFEKQFLHESGLLLGAFQHIESEEKQTWMIEALSQEALKSSEIEGEILNRESLRSSIARCFGLIPEASFSSGHPKIGAAEAGMAQMMHHLYQTYQAPLTHEQLFDWHLMLTGSRRDLYQVGAYRIHSEPMQIVSGAGAYTGSIRGVRVHFEAPPSDKVPEEMTQFIQWFNQSEKSLPCLTRAGIAHLFFVSIHPFEDGNGRIARALAFKAILQCLKEPVLIALSQTIGAHRKKYYEQLDHNNKSLNISNWLIYFSEVILTAREKAQELIEFLIFKAKLYHAHKDDLNTRQLKVLNRLFANGPAGFEGGLSAEKYVAIAQTSRATATRDLQELVEKKILYKTGALKGTRYYLSITPA